jgi:hypothetical protein
MGTLPDEPARRGFVRAMAGAGLAAMAAGSPERGLPFRARAPTPPMGWNSALAKEAGFTVPATALITMPDDMPPAFLVERFDIHLKNMAVLKTARDAGPLMIVGITNSGLGLK